MSFCDLVRAGCTPIIRAAFDHTPHYVQLQDAEAQAALGMRVCVVWDGRVFSGVVRWFSLKEAWRPFALCYVEFHETIDEQADDSDPEEET